MAAALTFTDETAALAQGRPPAGLSDRDRNLMDRERQLREIEKFARKADTKEPRLALTQVNEDFERLQVVSKEMVNLTSSGAAPNYKRVAEGMAEIKKRAGRLKANLMFPESGKDEKRQKNSNAAIGEELKPSLSTLDALIRGFVRNPVFQSAGIVDAQLSAKARSDLDDIAELSDKIRKSADKLNKTSGKPQ